MLAANDHRYDPPFITPTPPGPAVCATLTAREREVLELIATGRSNKAIASSLGLSPHTVKRHVANLFDKLELMKRSQATAWYYLNPQSSGCCQRAG